MQRKPITKPANLTIDIVARLPVIDPVAVANVEARLGAVPPNGVLHEPRKNRREGRVEFAGVDLKRHLANDVGAATGPITGGAV